MTGRPHQPEAVAAEQAASDEALLAQFVRERSEQAFALLVERHGPLVLGVCRRVLADVHDADDAFQATFLVLAIRAGKIRRRDALAAWLYGVAFRTSRRLMLRRRRAVSLALPEDLAGRADTFAEVAARHDRHVLDEELNRLPPKYRDPLVLHYLLGKPQQAVARELGESVPAIDGRMKRARRRLLVRLTARGVTVGGGLAVFALLESTGSAVSPALVAATVRTATLQAGVTLSGGATSNCGETSAGGAASTGIGSSAAIQLARQELAMMTFASTTKTAGAVLAGCAVVVLTLAGFAALNAGQTGQAGQAGEAKTGVQRIQLAAQGEAAAAPGAELQQLAQADSSGGGSSFAAPPAAEAQVQLGLGAVSPEMAKWAALDYKSRSTQEQKIVAALEESTTLEFIETPLCDGVEYLMDLHHIRILFDGAALDGVGVATDTPVTITLSGVSLRSALALLLRPLGLDYVIRNEVLLITTLAAAERTMETHVYELRHISHLEPEQVAEAIRSAIRPDTWREHHSPPSSHATVVPLGGALVVTQSQRGHEEIVELLEQLARFAGNPLYNKAP